MGLVSLPVSIFLYWLVLHPKKDDPFPKSGFLRLLIAGAVSVGLSVLLTVPINGILSFIQLGLFSDISGWSQAFKNGPAAVTELIQNASKNTRPTFLWILVNMFFSAGLLEEGLKYLTCRAAIRKEGMVRTWMDAVIAFSVVGITFELLENIAFGMNSDFLGAFLRSLASAHFVFGTIMGYFYGKYLVTGQKKYRWLSFLLPLAYHTITNAFMQTSDLGDRFIGLVNWTAISHMAATVVTIFIIFLWQKRKTLDVPVKEVMQR